jgi:phosphoglycerol transferase MdoB-like AlkP superfamily enzyme
MVYYGIKIKKLLLLLFTLLITFEICRWLFFLFNFSFFKSLGFIEFIEISFIGLRFDISAIMAFNSFFILLYLQPFSINNNFTNYQKILKCLFISINSILIFSNCIDFEYFKFILKRSSFDIFSLATTGDDLINLAPKYASDFWPIFGTWLSLSLILLYSYDKIIPSVNTSCEQNFAQITPFQFKNAILMAYIYLAACILCIIGIRGGIQLRPINIISAGKLVAPEYIPLVINTPFSMMKSFGNSFLKERKYFSYDELKNIYSSQHKLKKDSCNFRKLNVIVLIMESFSKEYIGALNSYEGYTPFLDSLISQALVFDHAFANGKKSIEGIAAVVASMPQLMNTPYILSSYSGNKINSFANILKKEGYQTAFYHGGNNGTMAFDAFSRIAGFEHYYGKNEYGKDEGYDGHWGIFDEEFLEYMTRNLNQTPQPFLACFFSLSSHHPYAIPEKYSGKFKKGNLPLHESIQYADNSLKIFFEEASQTSWFDSTLFVITADHTSLSEYELYMNDVGRYSIPIVFYMPGSNLKGVNHTVMSQTDILPSVLDYLCYNGTFTIYGESIFNDSTAHFSVTYLNDIYQIITGHYVLKFDGEKSISLFNYETDKSLKNNLLNKQTEKVQEIEKLLKAIIQDHNYKLLHNTIVENEF